METCIWCKKEFDKNDHSHRSVIDNINIPIGEPSFVEQQVIDGKCCSQCYYIQSGIYQPTSLASIPHCIKCHGALYPTIARNIEALDMALENGQFGKLAYHNRKHKELVKLEKMRTAKQRKIPITDLDKAYVEEALCKSCYMKEIEAAKPKKRRKYASTAPTADDYRDRYPAYGSV